LDGDDGVVTRSTSLSPISLLLLAGPLRLRSDRDFLPLPMTIMATLPLGQHLSPLSLLLLLPGALSRAPERWMPWDEACRAVRSMPNASAGGRRAGGPREERLIAVIGAGGAAAREALHTGAARMRVDLAARNVLCDDVTPCEVRAEEAADGSLSLTACVPTGAPALAARLCDVRAEMGLDPPSSG